MNHRLSLTCIFLLLLVSLAAAPVLAAALSSSVTCPSTCSCLLPEEAKKAGSPGYCNDQQKVCGSDTGTIKRYCYEKPVTVTTTTVLPRLVATGFHPVPTTAPVFVKCSYDCSCLFEPFGEHLTLCGGTKSLCGMDMNGVPKYCYVTPTYSSSDATTFITRTYGVLPVPSVPPSSATPTVSPSGTPEARFVDGGSFGTTYTFPITPCEAPCTCLEPDVANASHLSRCSVNASLVCGFSEDNKGKYCYVPQRMAGISTAACKAGCACLLPADAAKRGLSYCGGKQTTCTGSSGFTMTGASEEKRYCYTIPAMNATITNISRVAVVNRSAAGSLTLTAACPKGCSCLDEKTIRDRGYLQCSANRTACGHEASGEPLYCAKTDTGSSNPGKSDDILSRIGGFFGSLFGGRTSPAPEVQGASALASYCQDRYGPEYHMCNGACVNTQTDDNNCGGCGNWCNSFDHLVPWSYVCNKGQCIDKSDIRGPGECGPGGDIECPAGSPCLNGVCSELGCLDPGMSACNNTCIDTTSDDTNCGSCGNICAPGQRCEGGTCHTYCSEPGTGYCMNPFIGPRVCSELDSDIYNCGRCQHSCPTSFCSRGECVSECPADLTECNRGCVDTMTSEWNCGGCGNRCARDSNGRWTETCINGECRNPTEVRQTLVR